MNTINEKEASTIVDESNGSQAIEHSDIENSVVKPAEELSPAKPKATLRHKIFTAIGITLCVIFCLLLACNLTIIIKGSLYPDKPPSVLSITPMVVLSGSMSGDAPDHIEAGDLIFVSKAVPEKLKVGDIISFMHNKSVTTHRIISIETDENGSLLFRTKGDFNNTEDEDPVTVDNLVGIYRFRIPKVGELALFAQSPLGMVIFIGVPLIAFIAVDFIRRRRQSKKQKLKNDALQAELARLRILAAQSENKDSDAN